MTSGEAVTSSATAPRHRIIDAGTPGIPREDGRFNVNGPSVLRGLAPARQNGLRDPFVLDDGDSRRWLFYAAAGEDALGVIEMPARW